MTLKSESSSGGLWASVGAIVARPQHRTYSRVLFWTLLGMSAAMFASALVLLPWFLVKYGTVSAHTSLFEELWRWSTWGVGSSALVIFWYQVFKRLGSF